MGDTVVGIVVSVTVRKEEKNKQWPDTGIVPYRADRLENRPGAGTMLFVLALENGARRG